jgi:signal transduction histidine kinase
VKASRWSLRTQVTALCLAVAVALGVIALAAMVSAVHNQSQLDAVFSEATPMRVDGERLAASLYQQQSGVRGYLLNLDGSDLTGYQQGVAAESAAAADLARLLGSRPALRDKLTTVESQVAQWRSSVVEPAVARAAGGDAAGARALLAAGDSRLDAASTALDDLRTALTAVRDRAVQDARGGTKLIVRLLIAAALIVVVAGALLAVLLRFLVIRPLDRLVTDVQAVTAGDYEHQMSDDGPPELARLSLGVDQMRQRIVSDLAEVRTGRAALESANQQLEQQATELTRSNRDLEQFAYVASHDLQEPLRKVASFCQLLQRRYAGQLDERADQYIYFAVDGAQRMQRLINDLLAFSRIGRHTAGFTDVDLGAVAAEVVNQLDATIERAQAEITWDELPVVRGEEPLLSALLGNLVSNSIKFRRPDVPPKVHISARRVDDDWEISCQDNGIGIDAEFAEKVFVIFQRLHAKDAYPGTGIGLAVAKKIVEYHGGRIWLDDSAAAGSLIKFTLPVPAPVETAETAETAEEEPQPQESDEDRAKETV